MSTTVIILGSVLAVSLISFVGIGLFAFSESLIRRAMLGFVSFSTGVLLGDVFLHIIPEMAEEGSLLGRGVLLILLGVLISFCIEKFIHWHHCHILPSKDHYHPVGTMTLIADGLHNIVDGALIAGSFLVDTRIGVATTIAVMLHEIPQEISDYALLLYSGFSRRKALLWNFISGVASVIGAIIALLAVQWMSGLTEVLLALAAGNFLYIAGTDLIPELHKDTHPGRAVLQLFLISAGIAVMYGLTMLE